MTTITRVPTIPECTRAAKTLRRFMSPSQLQCVAYACRGEERDWFKAKMVEMAELCATMPKTYEQDGKGDQAVAHLHYFTGGCDWYITERDAGDPDDDDDRQHQAYGVADIGHGPEIGYVSIDEITRAGAELDLHFAPKTLEQVRLMCNAKQSP